MAAKPPQNGPLTAEQLEELWHSVAVDRAFAESLDLAGDGEGKEAYGQTFAQLARVSRAIDTTTQAMYILPWSGQSGPSAQGEARAIVDLTFQRSLAIDRPLVIGAGQVFFEHETTDWGENPGQGSVIVQTGRRYTLLHDLVFAPGEAGPFTVQAEAEQAGYGYNNPLPGTITVIDQPGSGFFNNDASVKLTVSSDTLVADDRSDTFVLGHVGQYVLFTAGANTGKVRRMVAYVPSDFAATPPTGGGVVLERTTVFEGVIAGSPIVGEEFAQAVTGAHLVLQRASGSRMVMVLQGGPLPDGTHVLTGAQSGATMTPARISVSPVLAVEVGTASWEVLDWVEDLGLTVTNSTQPSGGRVGFLDGLGKERAIDRSPNEPDALYAKRVATLADVVSPGAILRAANRVLAPFGISVCFREAGLALLPGLYYDAESLAQNDANAYDLDSIAFTPASAINQFFEGEIVTQSDPVTGQVARGHAICDTSPGVPGAPLGPSAFNGATGVTGTFQAALPVVGAVSGATYTPAAVAGGLRVEDRHKWVFDYLEMRAFFLLGVPTLDLGDFGMAYDAGATDAYDASPFPDFYDGYARTAADLYRTLWQSVNRARAAGVGFDLEIEDLACI